MRAYTFALTLVLSAALAACGGGGSSAPAAAATLAAPAVSVSTSTDVGVVGTPLTVTWNGTAVSNCAASGNWSGNLADHGSQQVTPTTTGPQTFMVSCGTVLGSASINVLPQYVSIPDPVFEAALVGMGVDNAVDGRVLTTAVLGVTQMSISREGYTPPEGGLVYGTGTTNLIQNLSGLESFVNLTTLRVENQAVASIDTSALTKLTALSLWQEPLNSIDLSHNTALVSLGLSETALTYVDISALTHLQEIAFQQDSSQVLPYTTLNGVQVRGFSNVDTSHASDLRRLYVGNNRLTSLSLDSNPALTDLWASDNHLSSLNLSALHNLNYVILYNNNLTGLNVMGTANNGLPARLYTTGNPMLTQIQVTSVSAAQAKVNVGNQGYFIDSWTNLVGGL